MWCDFNDDNLGSDNNNTSGPCAGSTQHKTEARGRVCEECGGEGESDEDNDDDNDVMMQVTFPCSASGTPTPSISWRREGGLALPKKRHKAYQGTLTITGLQKQDHGLYECVVSGQSASQMHNMINGPSFLSASLAVILFSHKLDNSANCNTFQVSSYPLQRYKSLCSLANDTNVRTVSY